MENIWRGQNDNSTVPRSILCNVRQILQWEVQVAGTAQNRNVQNFCRNTWRADTSLGRIKRTWWLILKWTLMKWAWIYIHLDRTRAVWQACNYQPRSVQGAAFLTSLPTISFCHNSYSMVPVPWLRRLVAGLSPRRSRFNRSTIRVGSVVDKATEDRFLSTYIFQFPLAIWCFILFNSHTITNVT